MLRRIFVWMNKHERVLSAVAMVAGFVADQLLFGRVDLPTTQAVFIAYVLICFVSISLLHMVEARVERGRGRPRWLPILPFATQFALGGFWSGFIVFYGRSAVFSASWPFLVLLALFVLGNEIFKKYHTRLVFTSVLFFFALYSYAIFAWPIVIGAIGTLVFIESSVIAILAFALFTIFLRFLGRERFLRDVFKIRVGAVAVLVLINFFYFANILPPLPLGARDADIYYSVKKQGDTYVATSGVSSWYAAPWDKIFGIEPVLDVAQGGSLSAYSAVFAPVKLATTIVHQWQWYNPSTKKWETQLVLSFPIAGGRDGGYRGYSTKTAPAPGAWRVNVETSDGRLIARIPFLVTVTTQAPETQTINLP